MSGETEAPNRWNLNSLLIICSIVGMLVTSVLYIAPLRTMPDDVRGLRADINLLQRIQDTQAETLKSLAKQAEMNRELERGLTELSTIVKRHDQEIDRLRMNLDRLSQH